MEQEHLSLRIPFPPPAAGLGRGLDQGGPITWRQVAVHAGPSGPVCLPVHARTNAPLSLYIHLSLSFSLCMDEWPRACGGAGSATPPSPP